jgi:hypothetical protein
MPGRKAPHLENLLDTPAEPLPELEVGAYAELAARQNPDRLVIQHIPALAAILLAAERQNGAPLTKEQVEALRDKSVAMAVNAEVAKSLEEKRGYRDVDPIDTWSAWQALRDQSTP